MNSHPQQVHSDLLVILTGYRDVTKRLTDLFRTDARGLLEMEAIEEALTERDRLFSLLPKPPEELSADVRELLRDIQTIDAQLTLLMQQQLTHTQRQVQGIQNQKRLDQAYYGEYARGSAYFDKSR